MNSRFRPRKLGSLVLPILLGAAFGLRFLVVLAYQPWSHYVLENRILLNDAYTYHYLALCIIHSHTFCGDTFRTPGYPSFIAILYSVFGEKPWVIIIAQGFVDVASIYLLYLIGRLVFSRRVGIVAALLLSIDPNAILATTNLWSDSLFVAVLLASFYMYLTGLIKLRGWAFLAAGALLGLAVLVRPVAQYYLVVLVICALFWPAGRFAVRAQWIALLIFAFVLSLSPWMWRNYALYGTPKISSIQGDNLLFWQVTYARAWEVNKPGAEVAREYKTAARAMGYSENGNPFVNEKITQRLAIQYIKTHPAIYASRWINGIIHMYCNLNTTDIATKLGFHSTPLEGDAIYVSETQSKLIADFFRYKSVFEVVAGLVVLTLLLINYLAFLLGTTLLIKDGRWALTALMLLSIFYFSAVGGPISLARFRLPVAPFYIVIGAFYIDRVLCRLEHKDKHSDRH